MLLILGPVLLVIILAVERVTPREDMKQEIVNYMRNTIEEDL